MTKTSPVLRMDSRTSSLERICGEVRSKCGSLRDASRLLPDMSGPESREMLLLMTMETFRLARFLDRYRQEAAGEDPRLPLSVLVSRPALSIISTARAPREKSEEEQLE
ncbi:MAG: hypothetical protein ACHQ2Z_12905 [Elusimicrobiota bacterium]